MELLKTFHLVATLKSMARAAEQLNVDRATITKHIRKLEQRLGEVKLMERYPSGIKLTEAGEIYLEYVQKSLEEHELARSRLKTPVEAEAGPLKILAVTSFGIMWFAQHAKSFQDLYPEIQLEIIYDRTYSLELLSAHSNAYVGLTTIEPHKDTPHIMTRLGSFYQYPYAHPEYLEDCGTPSRFRDLDEHKLIRIYTPPHLSYLKERQLNCHLYIDSPNETPRRWHFLTNDALARKILIQNKAGIGMLPPYTVIDNSIKQILENEYDPERGGKYNCYFVYPPHLKKYKRVELLRDFIVATIEKSPEFF